MSADGSKVFFTTADKLLAADTDSSADLYEADVDDSGNLDLGLITDSNSDACNPVANTNGDHWNTTGSAANCGAVAIAGGGGVAVPQRRRLLPQPRELDGTSGSLNQPNLYLAQRDGSPTFVATLEPNNPLVLDSVKASAIRHTGDFQVTPSGDYAAFLSDLELSGVHTFGFPAGLPLRRFRRPARLRLMRHPTDRRLRPRRRRRARPQRPQPDRRRPPLLHHSAGAGPKRRQRSQGRLRVERRQRSQLISAGIGPFDSGLLTASADGTNAFFFTHDTLALRRRPQRQPDARSMTPAKAVASSSCPRTSPARPLMSATAPAPRPRAPPTSRARARRPRATSSSAPRTGSRSVASA